MRLEYFTHWNAAATAALLPAVALRRAAGRPAAGAATAAVVAGAVVGVLGSWLLAYRMPVAPRFHRRVLRAQLWMHVGPVVLAAAVLALWPAVAGRAGRPADVARGLAAYGALFAAWLAAPGPGCARGPAKVAAVYHVPGEAGLVLAAGVALAVAAAGLCCARVGEVRAAES